MLIRIGHIIAILLLFSAEISLSQWFGIAQPHFIVAAIIAFALADDELDSLLWVVIGGLLLDFASGQWLGFQLLLLSFVAGSLLVLRHRFFQKPSLPLAFILSLIVSLGYEFCLDVMHGQLVWQLVIPTLSTAVVALLLYTVNLVVTKQREVIRFA